MLRGCLCGVSDALMNGAPVQCNIAGWEGAGREGGLGIGGRQLGNGFVQKIRQQEPPTRGPPLPGLDVDTPRASALLGSCRI